MLEGISPARAASIASNESSRPSSRPRNKVGTDSAASAPAPAGNRQVSSGAAPPTVKAEVAAAIASELDSVLKQVEGTFSVSVDRDTGMIVVRISDRETGEIVKQVPPQELMDADLSMEKIIGLLVDDEA